MLLTSAAITVPNRRRTIADFFKGLNIQIVRSPDTTNLAPDRQYIQLKAYSINQLNDALNTLEELGAKRIESPKRSRLIPPQMHVTPTRIASKPPVLPEIDLRSDEPIQPGFKQGIWTLQSVEKATFVPRAGATSFKPSHSEQTPQQVPQQQVATTPSTIRKASQESSVQDSPFQIDDEGDFVMKGSELRPRAETIAVDKVNLSVPEDLQSRIERSQSSPPKVAFSVLHKPQEDATIKDYKASWSDSSLIYLLTFANRSTTCHLFRSQGAFQFESPFPMELQQFTLFLNVVVRP